MENYICINGKKAELTEEQLKALGIELPKANPFARVPYNKTYFLISSNGEVEVSREFYYISDNDRFNNANYCTDNAILEQRALHETLNRLLWRFAMENNCMATDNRDYWLLTYDFSYVFGSKCKRHFGEIAFNSESAAKRALNEIAMPFIAAHPEFKF